MITIDKIRLTQRGLLLEMSKPGLTQEERRSLEQLSVNFRRFEEEWIVDLEEKISDFSESQKKALVVIIAEMSRSNEELIRSGKKFSHLTKNIGQLIAFFLPWM